MKTASTSRRRADALQLLALLVAKELHQEHCIDDAPAVSDYRIEAAGRHADGPSDLLVTAALGRGLSIDVADTWCTRFDADVEEDLDMLLRRANDFSTEIARVRGEARDIRATLSEVRAAAKREVGKAARRGLPITLRQVVLPPVRAGESAELCATVTLDVLGKSLRPEELAFDACCAEDVAELFESIREDQARRVDLRADLAAAGAVARIDAIAMNALRAAGLEEADILAQLRASEEWVVDMDAADGQRFVLHWDGTVWARIELGEGISWHEGAVHFKEAPGAIGERLAGRPLREVVPNELVADGAFIRRQSGAPGKWAMLHCTTPMLHFDAHAPTAWAA